MPEPHQSRQYLYKDCSLVKKWLSNDLKKEQQQQKKKKKPKSGDDGPEEKGDGYPHTNSCLMIFGGPPTYESRHR